jgi:hypothetical protein
MYQQSQQARADQQALQYAQLTPFQQANYAIGRGANMLGGAIGRGLGGEDPELARITMRQQIAGRINPNDPTSIKQGIEALAPNDPQGAMMLQREYQRLLESNALIKTRERERAAADPFQKLVESGKYTPASLADFQVSGKPADLVLYEKPEKPENLRSGEKREAVSNEMFDNRAFKDLTPKEKAIVNKRLEDEEGTRAREGAPKIYAPGQQVAPKDWMDFTQNVLSKDPIMQDTSRVLSEGPKLINIINSATSNDISAAALPKALSAFIGKDSSLSNLDIQTFARTGGLDNRLASDVNKFFTGRATEVKKEQAQQFAIALYRGALIERKKKLQTASEEFGYLTSPNYKFALKNIDDQLDQFKLVKKGEVAPTATKTGDPLIDKYLFPQAESK